MTYIATASDSEDGSLTPTCSPASGSTFALGTTTVNCSVTDSGSLTTTGSFTVTVQDTTPPVVTVPANITAEATSPSGAVVSFSASATDVVSGSLTPTCTPASGSTFVLGTTPVTCLATDAAGNTGSASFTVTVQDTTPPTLTVSDMTVQATGNSAAMVPYTPAPTATDLVDGSITPVCTPTSGASFPVGPTTVTCTATDAHGNVGTKTFKVPVTYNFVGFFQPVDNLPVFNVAKAGSAIPVKFSLSGNQGLSIFTATYPASGAIACNLAAQADTIEETVTAGGRSLSYDATTGQYIYVWKTDKAWAGQCRQLVVKLKDGISWVANFNLTK